MDKPRALTKKELAAIMPRLTGWKLAGNKLTRTFEFQDFVASLSFINSLVAYFETVDHHPDVKIAYGEVTFELTPEVALRIGIALGTALRRGDRVVMSRDGAPACRLLKRAVLSGILSTGVSIADLHVMPAPINRHFLKSEGLGAGVHVRPSSHDPEAIEIQFYEPPGIQATPEFVKEIEKHFLRQEYRRAAYNEVGQIGSPARAPTTSQ